MTRGQVRYFGGRGWTDAVLPAPRAAAALLEHATGVLSARLWVFEDNRRALAFYAKHGFEPDGHRQVDPDAGVWERRLARRAQAPVSQAG